MSSSWVHSLKYKYKTIQQLRNEAEYTKLNEMKPLLNMYHLHQRDE